MDITSIETFLIYLLEFGSYETLRKSLTMFCRGLTNSEYNDLVSILLSKIGAQNECHVVESIANIELLDVILLSAGGEKGKSQIIH
jgi:hypothetical protein